MISELLDYTGGISTATAPHLLPLNESVLAVNADLRSGSLKSLPEELPLMALDGRYFFNFLGKIYSYTNLRSNVLWDGKWYWTDGSSTMKMLADGTIKPLGIAAPTYTLTIAAGTGTLPLTGTFQYTYTYYDSVTGVESAPANLSNSLTVTNKDIVVTGFQVTPPTGATHIRLYRIGGYLADFTLVSTIALNTTTFTDNLDYASIDGRLLQTLRTSAPPVGLNYLTELNGRMYGSIGNKVYYSSLGNPDAWYVDDFFVVNNTVTALGTTSAGLVIFTYYTTNVLRGTGPETFYLKELSSNVGCMSHYSIAQYQASVMWLSADAFNISDGFSLTDLTSHKIVNISGMYPRGTTVRNLTYYMTFGPTLTPKTTLYPSTTLFPNRVIGGVTMSEGIVCINFTQGRTYSYTLIESKGVGNIATVNAKALIGSKVSNIAFPVCSDHLLASYYLPMDYYLSDIGSVTTLPKTMTFTTSMIVDGSYSTLKEYDKVRVIFTGSFTITVILDGVGAVITQSFTDADSSDGFFTVGIPNSNNKGYGIQYHIVGAGDIRAIQHTWQPRSTP